MRKFTIYKYFKRNTNVPYYITHIDSTAYFVTSLPATAEPLNTDVWVFYGNYTMYPGRTDKIILH